eukprot:GHRR01030192.1.p1 GENE.GHRR01030192.1~~GHRR01030192.1.p1  ORF type:complete len:100 (+),score=25.50 GHRR01030192.1:471-770(+)
MLSCHAALASLLLQGNSKAASQQLEDLADAIQQTEPNNAGLMVQLAAPFARLAGSCTSQLTTTLGLAEKAVQLQPDNIQYVSCGPQAQLWHCAPYLACI